MLGNNIKKTVVCSALAVLFTSVLASKSALAQTSDTFGNEMRELLDEYCAKCHNFEDYAGGLDLGSVLPDAIVEHAPDWERAIRRLRAGVMPPPGQERPPGDRYMALTEWLESEIDRAAPLNPGSKMLHRLNRIEYQNVVRDLLGLEIDASALLPADTGARGFDNIAGSLTISPTLLEAYTTAAARVARMAVGYWKSPTEVAYIAPGDTSQNFQLDGMPFGTRGGMAVRHNFLADGNYTFHMQNFGVGSFIPGEQLELSIDGERVHLFEYTGVGMNVGMGGDRDGALEVTLPVTAGTHLVGATFVATNFRPPLDIVQQYDRKSIENEGMPQVQYPPVLGLLKIQGPFDSVRPVETKSLAKILTCRPAGTSQAEAEACARKILLPLIRRGYRRPATPQDLDVLMAFFDEGARNGIFEDGIELSLRRLLADPEFLVRVEKESVDLKPGQVYAISDLELASRLSFFLWSSIPDDELLDVAVAKQLNDPAILSAQVERMLADPRSASLVNNFAQQWLYLRNLPGASPDGIFYPNWDDELRDAFQKEAELFFASIVKEDRSVLELLDANYTFVNERLARHYGIPNVYGAHFRRVTLGPEFDQRRGILGKGSFLAITFTENFRTSPVKRGIWVIENILGTVPPEMPANVPPLEETAVSATVRTLREQLTLHRADPACATCHKIMDPIGFALENFAADGAWRTTDGHPRKGDGSAVPLDTKVELWDGTEVDGVIGLRENLLKYSPQFVRFMVEKLMTYGLGRGTEYYDMPVIRSIVKKAESDNYKFSSLILNIVDSEPFRMRVKQDEAWHK
ncbi:MAG: DUF1592 domain-containing protein [Pseudomonadales bacterium]|nr:DUF1592 domain-containing protein [Pseudomonadales bacterium]